VFFDSVYNEIQSRGDFCLQNKKVNPKEQQNGLSYYMLRNFQQYLNRHIGQSIAQ